MQSRYSDQLLAILAFALLGAGCLLVLWPFLTSLVWAGILVSSSWPAFLALERLVGGRRALGASLMTVLVMVVLLGPIAAIASALADNIVVFGRAAAALLQEGLPKAPAWLAQLPMVGGWIDSYWQLFVNDGERLMAELIKLSEPAQAAALAGGRLLGEGVVDVSLSVFLAFFFFLNGEELARRLHVGLKRLLDGRADHLVEIVRGTLSGVIHGILGTALAQGSLAAVGLAIAGVPGAVLLGMLTFFFSLVPVGPPLIWGGVAVWLFQNGQVGWAIFIVAWGFLLVSTIDNIIKPFIISRGSRLPFAIVFLGILGGALAFGVIGVFLGPTLLAVGFRLVSEWTSTASD